MRTKSDVQKAAEPTPSFNLRVGSAINRGDANSKSRKEEKEGATCVSGAATHSIKSSAIKMIVSLELPNVRAH